MSDAVRLIALGGYGEIGKNMTVLECGDDLLLIDAGIAFPEEDSPLGVDLLIPNYSYLRENRERLVGIMLTHGHEDHIGGLPYVLRDVSAPLYGTSLTLGLVRAKLGQHKLAEVDLNVVQSGDRLRLGAFDLECIRVNHSIPDCLGLGIRTPQGTIVHSGDFKFDHTPVDGLVTDFAAYSRLGDEGVRLLVSDSTNIERAGHTPSEAVVGRAFERLFPTATGRIIVASFASQIHRIQQVFDVAASCDRYVLVAGRSMERNVNVARELGYLHFPDSLRVGYGEAARLPDDKLVVLITGVQGEPVSGLARLARGRHPKLRLHPNDMVILSATPIPGNEATVWRLINDLLRGGARVVDHREDVVHVSGHASREEIALLFNLVRPEYAAPFHGEYRHMIAYGDLAQEVGLPHDKVFLLQNGDVLKLDENGVSIDGTVPHGVWTIDGRRVNELGASDTVFQDRSFLAASGVISAAVCWDFVAGEPVGRAMVGVRGVRETEDPTEPLTTAAAADLERRLGTLNATERVDRAAVEKAGKKALRAYFERATSTYPVLQFLVVGSDEQRAGEAEVTGGVEEQPAARAILAVDGAVRSSLLLGVDDLSLLARPEEAGDELGDQAFVALDVVLEAAGLEPGATHLTVAGEQPGTSVELPLESAASGKIVFAQGDQPLTEEDGGPVRLLLGDDVVRAVTRLTVERHATESPPDGN